MKAFPSFPIAAVIGLSSLLLNSSIAVAASPRPNVILILTDDQGYGDLSCHGNPVLKTPNLDRLHAESIRLTDFHAAPMCTPTRSQLLTGVDALRNGAMNVSSGRSLLRREFPTMAEIFAANGYRTGLFGKWHLGDNYPYRPQDRGFQETIWFPSSHISSAPDFWNNDYFDDVYFHNGARESFKGYCTDVFFDEATQWMQQAATQKEPFFCYISLNTPHSPLFVPDEFRDPYRNQKPFIASFLGMIANIDENIGKLEKFLRESGLRENTILIFMTDNGTANGDSVFNAGMRGKKIDLYDGGHRVPFFIRWPAGKLSATTERGLQAASTSESKSSLKLNASAPQNSKLKRPEGRAPSDIDTLTQCQDVLPTLIDLCDLKKPRSAKFDGVSLAKLLKGKTETLPDRMLVSQFSRMNDPSPEKGDAVVLWKKWRLVKNAELYDVAIDSAQQHNVIAQFPEVTAKMRKHYERWWKSVEPRVNEFSPIHIGSHLENPMLLTPCEWRDVFLDQQGQVRRQKRNGTWTLFVERDGEYEFSLRRWPSESELRITEGATEHEGPDGVYRPGDALPIARAEFKISNVNQTKPITDADKKVTFKVSLTRGPAELQTFFRDAEGNEICGAYYVYVSHQQK